MFFEPLGMTTAGFGAPASVDKSISPGSQKKILSAGTPFRRPVQQSHCHQPAGAVHCSMGDLAKNAAFHMAGERGKAIAQAESFKKLHTAVATTMITPSLDGAERAWANGRASDAQCSNTIFYVVVWMPEKKLRRDCRIKHWGG